MSDSPPRRLLHWTRRRFIGFKHTFLPEHWDSIMDERNPTIRTQKLFSKRFHWFRSGNLKRTGQALDTDGFANFLATSFEKITATEVGALLRSINEPESDYSFLTLSDKRDAELNRNIGGRLHHLIIEMKLRPIENISKEHARLWQALIDELLGIANRHGPPPASGKPAQKTQRKVGRQKRSSPKTRGKTTSKPTDSPPITNKENRVKRRTAHVPAITQGQRQQEVQPPKDEYREVPDALELDRLSHSPPEPVVVGSTDSQIDEVSALDVASEHTPDKMASEVLKDQERRTDDVVEGSNAQANEDDGAYFEHLQGTDKDIIEKLHKPIRERKIAAAKKLEKQKRVSEGIIKNAKTGARQSNERLNQKANEQIADIRLRASADVAAQTPQTPWTGIDQDSVPLKKTDQVEISESEIIPSPMDSDLPFGASVESDGKQEVPESSASNNKLVEVETEEAEPKADKPKDVETESDEPKVAESKTFNAKPVSASRKPLVGTKSIAKPSPKPQPKSLASHQPQSQVRHQSTSEGNAPTKAAKGTSLMDRIRQEGKTKKPVNPSNVEKPKPREKPSFEVILESSDSVRVYRSGRVDTRIPLANSGYAYTAGTFSNGTVDSETLTQDDPSRDENQDLIVVRKEADSTLLLMFDGVGGVTFPRQFAEYFAEEVLELPSLRSLSAEKFLEIQQNSSNKYHGFYERNIERLTEGKSRIVRRKIESIGSRGASTFLAIEMDHITDKICAMSLGDSNIFAFDMLTGDVVAMLPNKRATGSVKALDTSAEQFRDFSEVEQKEFFISDQHIFIMMTDGYSDAIRALEHEDAIGERLTDFCSMMIDAESKAALSRTIAGIEQGRMDSDDMSYLLLYPDFFSPPEYQEDFPEEEE